MKFRATHLNELHLLHKAYDSYECKDGNPKPDTNLLINFTKVQQWFAQSGRYKVTLLQFME